jgi:hypothetical protein
VPSSTEKQNSWWTQSYRLGNLSDWICIAPNNPAQHSIPERSHFYRYHTLADFFNKKPLILWRVTGSHLLLCRVRTMTFLKTRSSQQLHKNSHGKLSLFLNRLAWKLQCFCTFQRLLILNWKLIRTKIVKKMQAVGNIWRPNCVKFLFCNLCSALDYCQKARYQI